MKLGSGGALAVMAALAMAAPVHAAGMKVQSLTAVSGPSPFSGCPFDAPPPFTDREWQPRDSAVEPHIAIDPKHPKRMAAVWMQDVTASVVVAHTRDGGRTWQRSVPPKLGKCTGADEGTVFDPRLAFGGDGLLYLSVMRRLVLRPGRTTADNEVAVVVSPDGGRTWRDPVVVEPRSGLNDYPHIAADPDLAGHAYLTFTQSTEPVNNALATKFAATMDGGRTWSAPRTIHSERLGSYYNGMIVGHGKGRLTAVRWVYDAINYLPVLPDTIPSRLVTIRSADGGRTWSAPVTVGQQTPKRNGGDPESGEGLAGGNPYSVAAPDGGLFIAWQDYDGSRSRLQVMRGRPDGTWEAPIDVVPWAAPLILLPVVAVTPEGTLGVMWYDTRSDAPGDGRLLADVRMAVSRDGGRTFDHLHVAGPFDLRASWSDARSPDGSVTRFLGDYTGMVARPHGFAAALPLTAPVAQMGRSQLFVAEVGEPPAKTRKAKKKKKKRKRRRGRRRG